MEFDRRQKTDVQNADSPDRVGSPAQTCPQLHELSVSPPRRNESVAELTGPVDEPSAAERVHEDNRVREYAASVIQAVADDPDGSGARFVAGRRADVLRVLSQLLIRTDLLTTYVRALVADGRRTAHDRSTTVDFPAEDVVRDGLDCLTDGQIARLAVDAVGLAIFHDYLMELYEDGECGQVWYDTMLSDTEFLHRT
jgi:hypothetical protein